MAGYLKGLRSIKENLNNKSELHYKNHAFTLAEVLITLGIIGIVAAMTLPALINQTKDKELEVRTKKAFSVISQAAQLAQHDLGTPGDNSSLFNPANTSAEVTKNFSKYFIGAKYCDAGSNAQGCGNLSYRIKYNYPVESSNGTNGDFSMDSDSRIVLEDGTLLGIRQMTQYVTVATCNQWNADGSIVLDDNGNQAAYACTSTRWAIIFFDVNGIALPNQFGRDVFSLYVLNDKIVPNSGWTAFGSASLKNILTGKGAAYTDYTSGQEWQW